MILLSRHNRLSFWLFTICGLLIINACRKNDDLYTGPAQLKFSEDTVVFDTVFTSPGPGVPRSFNRQLIVKNTKDQPIRTSIQLAGGEFSAFRVNVDGIPGVKFDDIEIFGRDSIFIFLEITADRNGDPSSNPLIIRDSLMFNTNGNIQHVQLRAWGQDGQYFFKDTLCDMVWDDQLKPYVVYDYIYVPEGCKLTINEGVRVFMAPQSWIYVEGELAINGTLEKPVFFEGDRLERAYDSVPGQYGGIWLAYPSTGNKITHLRMKNGVYGIVCDSVTSITGVPNVIIKNTETKNMLQAGLVGRGSMIYAENCIFANSGEQGFRGLHGGIYDFRHCTIASFGNRYFSRRNPTFYVTNRERDEFNVVLRTFDLEMLVTNCIVFGSLQDEFGFDILSSRAALGINNNVIRTTIDDGFFNGSVGSDNILHSSSKVPMFVKFERNDYHLISGSTAIDNGKLLSPAIPLDFDGNMRDANPDAGAFEFLK